MPTAKAWRMPTPCANCPFNSDGSGLALRKSLRPGRFGEIRRVLASGGDFTCHKTALETGDGSELLCAGALDWQKKHRVSSQMARIYERLHVMAAKKTKVAR